VKARDNNYFLKFLTEKIYDRVKNYYDFSLTDGDKVLTKYHETGEIAYKEVDLLF